MPTTFYILISVLLNVFGQLSIKLGTKSLGPLGGHFDIATLWRVVTNPGIIGGLAIYALGAAFWIVALSRTDLSYAYPFLSLGYVLVMLASYWILNEHLSIFRIVGVGFIVVGLIFISWK